jgi:hypothetical protein
MIRGLVEDKVKVRESGMPVTRDYLEGELAKLDREWRSVKVYRAAAATAGAAALVSTAALIGVTGAGQANALIPLVAGASSLVTGASAVAIDALRVKSNDMYVLWKARH